MFLKNPLPYFTAILLLPAACKAQTRTTNDLTIFGLRGKLRTVTERIRFIKPDGKELVVSEQTTYFNPAGNRDSILFYISNVAAKNGKRIYANMPNGDTKWTQVDTLGKLLSNGSIHWVNDKLYLERTATRDKKDKSADSVELDNDYHLARIIHRAYSHDSLTDYMITRQELDAQGRLKNIYYIVPGEPNHPTVYDVRIEGYDAKDNPLKLTQSSKYVTIELVRNYTYYD